MLKKLFIFLVVLILLAGGGILSLPMLVNKDALKDQIVASFKGITGTDLEIQGNAVLQTFPSPHIVINSLYVRNTPDASAPFLLTVNVLDAHPSVWPLLQGKLVLEDIKISGVNVEIEHLKNNKLNLDVIRSLASSAVPTKAADLVIPSLVIEGAHVHYADAVAATSTDYNDISGTLNNKGAGAKSSVDLQGSYGDSVFKITGKVKGLDSVFATGVLPVDITVTSGKSTLSYDGDIGLKNDNYVLNGKAALDTNDMVKWVSFFLGNKIKPEDSATGLAYASLPFKAKGEVHTEGSQITLSNLLIDSAAVKGSAKATIGVPYKVDLSASIEHLDLETLFASGLFEVKEVIPEVKKEDASASYYVPPKSIWDLLQLTANVTATDMNYNNRHIKNTHLDFDMSNGEMTISQASALLPGNSRVVFTGLGKESYQGFALEGEVDAAGDNFIEMMDLFKSKGLALPAEDFKRFRIRTNAVISGKEVRLSEMAVRIEDMALVGGIITSLGEHVHLQSSLRIGGVNLDHFIALWGLKEWEDSFMAENLGKRKEGFLSEWLNHLGYDLKLNASLEQYIIGGKTYDKSAFKMDASAGRISFSDVVTSYNGVKLSGGAGIDVSAPLPNVHLDITADSMDTASFFGGANETAAAKPAAPVVAAAPNAPTERWAHKELDFHWLELLNATYHFKFAHFKDGKFVASDLETQGKIENRTLVVDNFSANALDGQIVGKLSLLGGKIPSLTIDTSLLAVNAGQLSELVPLLQGMTGKYNLSLRLNTNGIDVYSWVSNLEGSVGFGGSNIIIHGFDLPGIVNSVNYVRTVADILNVVKQAFPGGDTLFSHITGEGTIMNGVLKAEGVKMISEDSTGMLSGEIDLVNWKIQTQITFALKSLNAQHPPTMTIALAGNIDNPEKSLDTRSLEQYVATRSSEKMLKQYGTH